MKFLDLNGLKHLLKFMDRTVSVKASDYSLNSQDRRDIPFITNHQIINVDIPNNINVFNWFKGASEGGTLEIIPTSAVGLKRVYCINDEGTSILYGMVIENTPSLKNLDSNIIPPTGYIRLIKLDEKLIVTEYFINAKHY